MNHSDGLVEVDIVASIALRRSRCKLVAVADANPPGRWGVLDVAGPAVKQIREKPERGDAWINGGFFVLEPASLDLVEGDGISWERAPMEQLASSGQLMAFEHGGFWQPMDTLREKMLLEELWNSGRAPWKRWGA